jgi:hypothetical protein
MRTTVALIATLLLLASPIAHAQDPRTALEAVARAMGADSVKTLEYTGTGVNFAPGQSQTPGPAVAALPPQELHTHDQLRDGRPA